MATQLPVGEPGMGMPEATVSLLVPSALDGERLDRTISLLTGRTRAESARLIDHRKIILDEQICEARSFKVHSGGLITIAIEPEEPPLRYNGPKLDIVWEDEHLIVVDKPAGLVVHPGAGTRGDTLSEALVQRYEELAQVGDPLRPGIVHRLDKGTSGLLVVARSQVAFKSLVNQMSERIAQRRYLAVVAGHIVNDRGIVDAPIGRSKRDPTRMTVATAGRPARTNYTVLERLNVSDKPFPTATLTEIALETGRTHQVRVHMAAIGHPVVGDLKYGGPDEDLGRPFLHAFNLSVLHPLTGERMNWRSKLPTSLRVALQAMGGSLGASGPTSAENKAG